MNSMSVIVASQGGWSCFKGETQWEVGSRRQYWPPLFCPDPTKPAQSSAGSTHDVLGCEGGGLGWDWGSGHVGGYNHSTVAGHSGLWAREGM